MPSNSLEYQRKNAAKYWTNPEAKKKRAARWRARYKLMKEWKVKVWDWLHVNHKTPLSKWWSNSRKNLEVISAKKNMQDWARIANNNKKKKKWKK